MRSNLLRLIAIVSLTCGSALATPEASKAKAPEIKEVKRKEIKNETTITIQEGRGDIHKEQQSFCGKTQAESQSACQTWLKEQKANLGDKVLTSSCGQAVHLYGKEKENCVGFLSKGSISFLIK